MAQMAGTFGRKVITGVGWTLGSAFAVRLMQFLVTVSLARLLAPSAFGLFALTSMIIVALGLFRDLGFGQALIYHKTEVRKNAETTFILSGVFGIAAWGIVYAASPLVARIFGNQELLWPLRVMSFSVVVSSLATVPSILLERELEFRRRAMPEFAMGLSYAAVSLALALNGFGVWSLVVGHIVSVTAQSAVTWMVAGWRPVVSFHRDSAERVLNYGKPLMAATILYLSFFYIDSASIGKWLGVTALGYYNLAFTICNLPATNITHVVNRVMYPAYSKLNEDLPALRAAHMQTVKGISLLTFPIAVWLFLAPGDFVAGFFGQKWLPAVPLFRVLAFYGMFRSIGATAGSVFMAVGEPKWIYRLNSLQLAVAVPLVYTAATRFGTIGVAALFTFAYTMGTTLALWKMIKILGVTSREYASAFKVPLLCAVTTVAASFFLAKAVLPAGAATAVGSGVLALITYPLAAIRLDGETYRAVRSVLTPPANEVYQTAEAGKRAAK